MASVLTVCSIVFFSTGATWTVTVGSLSTLSPEQPAATSNPAVVLRTTRRRAECDQRPSLCLRFGTSAGLMWSIRLEGSSQNLQVCDGDAKADLAIVVRFLCLGKGVLRIHNL